MAAHLASNKLKEESSLSYNTFENRDESEDHCPNDVAIEAENNMPTRHKLFWFCFFSCCKERCKICACGSEETVSDDVDFAMVKYLQV